MNKSSHTEEDVPQVGGGSRVTCSAEEHILLTVLRQFVLSAPENVSCVCIVL